MSINIGINGLGRIGRCLIRAICESSHDINIVAVNNIDPLDVCAHLLRHDSIHGKFNEDVEVGHGTLKIGKHMTRYSSETNPALIEWGKASIVFDCTGRFNEKADSEKHLRGSVERVIVSGPSDSADATIVLGVNQHILSQQHKVISIGSCTTNALAPVAHALHSSIGIELGYMTTIHAYTNDQNLTDNSHKDLRRARAAALSMIPSSTGAAKAIGKVIPDLAGKLSGSAIRVPVPNVSMIDLSFVAARNTTKEEVNEIIRSASENELNGILTVAKEPLVSIDFNHNPSSSIFDPFETHVISGKFVRVVAWYDNEWGFVNRLIDIARLVSFL